MILNMIYISFLLKLCGCGNPKETYNFYVNALNKPGEIIELIKSNSKDAALVLINHLNHLELLEHGSSIYGSYLTDKGKKVGLSDDGFINIALLQFYGSVGYEGVSNVIEMIKDNPEETAKTLINIFKDYELLDDNLTLTSDGTHICNLESEK